MSKTTACACRSFEFGSYDPDTEQDDTYTTGCKQTTTRVFAQGHDAKLVGFLVRAQLAGEEISRIDGGRVSFADAVTAANTISEPLALKAQAQLDAAKARIAKKAAREAAKAARKSAKAAAPAAPAKPEPTTRQARIKVGRWEYDATIDIATGEATHTRKLGGTRTLALGEYKEI
jgi:hypothetical protein